MKNKLFLCLLLSLQMFSCVPYKKTIYLKKNEVIVRDSIPHFEVSYKIKPGDILAFNVTSYNKQVTEFYNSKPNEAETGFEVRKSGYIIIPLMDSILVEGLTVLEVKEKLTQNFAQQVNQPYVTVKLLSFKVTILGEIRSPGVISAPTNELTILEAMAIRGDITEFGDKTNVKLIREEGNYSQIVTLDLTKREIIANKYFYLQPNDIIYIEPFRAKSIRSNVAQLGFYIGLLNFAFIVINYLSRR